MGESTIATPEEAAACAALRAEGRDRITDQMVREWLDAHKTESPQAAPEGRPLTSEHELRDQALRRWAAERAQYREAVRELQSETLSVPLPHQIVARIEQNRAKRSAQAEANTKAALAYEDPPLFVGELPEAEGDDDETPGAEQPAPKRLRGRPPSRPWWLPEAAKLVASGLTLRRALRRLGVDLSVAERRNVYRWKRFRELLAAYRREHERDGGNFRD